MYILDSHVHTGIFGQAYDGTIDEMRAKFLKDIAEAGVSGSQIMSGDPRPADAKPFEDRLHDVMEFCTGYDNLFPIFWINPVKDACIDEIDKAVEAGVDGFKIIPSEFYPSDEYCMAACKRIAEHGKSVVFHSGISWDGVASADHMRPAQYECMLDVPKLKFAVAHVSWPWTDECIAVYGKMNNAKIRRPDLSCEMFIDTTPGTPEVYRRQVLERLYCSDYQVKYNVLFGTDCMGEGYNIGWTKKWLKIDEALIREFNPDDADDVVEHVFGKNFLRFIGKSEEKIDRIYPQVAV